MQDTDEYDELDDAGDSHATLGSVILDCLEDKEFEGENEIPFKIVHNNPVPFKSRRNKIFIPNTPITAKIIKYERSVTTHLLNPYLYTIQLQHGDFTWIIEKRYVSIQILHQQLKLFKATLKIPFPSEKHKSAREDLKELQKIDENLVGKPKSSLPRFPNRPEVLIGYDQIDERVSQLEDYLNNLLSIGLYRNHPDTIEFLSVSRFSFVKDLGVKGKEEFVEKQRGSMQRRCDCFGLLETLDCFSACSDLCTYNCHGWNKRWIFVKDTFVGYVRARDGLLRGVLLFDSDFEVASAFSNIRKRDRLQILNLQRRLLIKCDGNRKRQDLANYIKEIAKKQGYGFTQDNRYSCFAPKRTNCTASWFVDGSSYMSAVADAINNAKEEIFITDWWLSPEIYLKRPVVKGNHEWRLDRLLEKKANEGVRIFVLLYKEVKQALGLNSYYSRNTLRKLHSENIKILRHPDHAKSGVFLWAHHEKIVCIDQTTAFVGGIDLCYGRWDTSEHRLSDFGGSHIAKCSFPGCNFPPEAPVWIKDCKNSKSCVSRDATVDSSMKEIINMTRVFIEKEESKEGLYCDTVNGDLNFENEETGSSNEEMKCDTPELERKSFLQKVGDCFSGNCFTAFSNEVPAEKTAELIMDQPEEKESPSTIKRTRSVDEKETSPVLYWVGKDYTNFILKDFCDLDAPFTDLLDRKETPRMPWHDIGTMVHGPAARDIARHFIQRWNAVKVEKVKKLNFYPYLMPKSYENFDPLPKELTDVQFSVSCQALRSVSAWSAGFLNPEYCEESIHRAYLESIIKSKYYIYIENQFFISLARQNAFVKNRICEELCNRIVKAHNQNQKFRVYVVIPLLPGFEGEIGRRSGSSLHAITHWNYSSICKGKYSLFEKLKESGVDNPSEYITFHGLRKYSEFCGTYVSELIYVHSKLMIVDDKIVICGSANINDRSMLGSRDSEIALILKDEEYIDGYMNEEKVTVGKYASSLRKHLFAEHLGILNQCHRHYAGDQINPIDLIDPVSDDFYNKWLATSANNTKIYEEVFNCFPSDKVSTFREFNSYCKKERLIDIDLEKSKNLLLEIKGHLVDLPLKFLNSEDLSPKLSDGMTGLMPMTIWT